MSTDGSDGQTTVPVPGDVFTHDRTFTVEDVREFGQITGDQQSIHTDPDTDGRLITQGLLTGSLLTKIGGDLSYIARTLDFEFLRPVYTGEPITCEWTVESRTEQEDRYRLENAIVFRNEADQVVIEAETTGLIWKDDTH